ncbi:MAG TPA: 2-oxoglutarate dehydrogenase complex dihydrolipoyllysine-residue succinyltransferase [Gemmatimonadaceae bacterium]|nr:2-oxoglutarate dehydrogenase complex dihydrolipoyllysine-residue succinyltransferase [Gemmatimonadaceae bacterium]
MTAIKVPPLGESIVEATVSRWLKHEGDAVSPGESLVELETDKITVEVPAMLQGRLVKRLHAEGDIVKVDDVLCEIDEAVAGLAVEQETGQPRVLAPSPGHSPAVSVAAAPEPSPKSAPRASPAAQRTAEDHGVDLRQVEGTGRGGVVSKADVLDELNRASAPVASIAAAPPPRLVPPAPSPAGLSGTPRETREKLSTRRRRMAEHLLEAQHATAHLTTFNEIDMSTIAALRQRLKGRIETTHGIKLSFMPFFVKAACLALREIPSVNAQMDGDSIVYKHYVHMGIAVASEGGLVVPVIRDADRKSILEVGRELTAMAQKAREGKLTMDDLTGGSFTITNGGVFGSLVSTPILNYPQVGILGLHKIQDRPVAVDGRVEIRPMMYVALSYDHRIIEGQHAVLFLVRVKELMEDPGAMLVE